MINVEVATVCTVALCVVLNDGSPNMQKDDVLSSNVQNLFFCTTKLKHIDLVLVCTR